MRKTLDRFFPLETRRRNFLFKLKRKVKNGCITIYRTIPFGGIKRVLKRSANHIGMYHQNDELIVSPSEFLVYDKFHEQKLPSKELSEFPKNKKIAMHLHLYYKDLVDEMIRYLNHIPYPFDLYVSVIDAENNKHLEEKLTRIKKVNKVVLTVTRNSGRDYGPMMVEFGKTLGKYDYVGHIHTKKSLRMGASQDAWRTHLLEGILGNESLIKNIFYLFEHENVGIFFQDSIDLIPYWAGTWLGVERLASQTFRELGIPFSNTYQDFSAGSMFWVKTEATKEIFNRRWTWEDFGEEKGLNDGTLAYVFERGLFVQNAQFHGYDFICYNLKKHLFYKNYSERNRDKYYQKTLDQTYHHLANYDVISFDIFDTLLARKIYSPSDLYCFIHEKVKDHLPKGMSFPEMRRHSEISAWEKISKEPNIHDIYKQMQSLYKISKEESDHLKEIEISVEKEFLIPRKDMLEIFNRLKKAGKKIILTSDMYLTSDILSDILKNCGYKDYEKIYVSCEWNKRKDRGDFWEIIKDAYPDQKLIHVGDNEESDIHQAGDLGMETYHIMQGKRMFEHTRLGEFTKKNSLNSNSTNAVLNGLIINKKLFNSPFKLHDSNGEYAIESLNEFGYATIGPIILKYLIWLIQESEKEKDVTYLFLAREGYYFEKLFAQLLKDYQGKKPNYVYFQTSRRCVTVATIKSEKEVYDLLDIEYYGDMKSFMYYRYGVEYNGDNFNVTLSKESENDNRDQVKKVLETYMESILDNAKKERQNYLKYIKKTVPKNKNTKLCVVDLGYSGTTQLYLSKLLDEKIAGNYLVVKNHPKPLSIGCDVKSCYNELENDNNHILYKNGLFLECFLTAPNGQLMHFDDKLQPIFTKETKIKEKMKYLDQIYDGVSELFSDLNEILGDKLFQEEINKENTLALYEAFLLESKHFIEQHKEIFTFEDFYCRSDTIVVEQQKQK